MNHIKQLTMERDGLSLELRVYHEAICDLRNYLYSDKFKDDTTVQVKDVLLRISEAQERALTARTQFDNAAIAADRALETQRQSKLKFNCEGDGCNYFGKDWDDCDMGGITLRLCRKCHDRQLRLGNVVR